MVRVTFDATKVLAVAAIGLTLCGCTAFRQAIGAAKNPPDEFTVLTKAPLVIPPDFNLRPPQPGAAARNEPDPDVQAREALFPQNAAAQAAALGAQYSEGERFLLTRTNALAVDANIRRRVTSDAGQEDLGPEFAQRLLTQPAGTPAQPAQMQAAATPAPPPMQAAAAPPMRPEPAAAPPMAQQPVAAPAQVARAELAQPVAPSPIPAPAPAASAPAANTPAPIVLAANPPLRPEPATAPPAAPVSEPPALRGETLPQPAVASASILPPTVVASAAAPPTAAVATPAPPAGGFVLQIGAYKNEQQAASALRALNGRSQSLSQLAPQRLQIVNLSEGGTLYRLQAGQFADRFSATNACEALKSEGVECFVSDPSQSPANDQASLSPGG